jgi:hypothetical protein
VSLVPPTVAPSVAAQDRRSRAGRWAPWLVIACYLLAAIALTWRLWADPASREQSGDVHDIDLFAWFLRYTATAVSHGHLPALVTTALNAPQGVNLMWNTSVLLPGIVLTPVTLLAGPQVSLTVLLTLGYAGSAASLFFVLRRWGVSLGAAALGGAVYGFSPALIASGIGHYHLQFAVLPPLIIHALLRIVTGRARPVWGLVRTGAWLGLLTSAQLFTGEELLLDTAVAGLVLVVVLAASRPSTVAGRARGAAFGILAGVVVMLVICGHALSVQFFGPFTERGRPLTPINGSLVPFVTPPGELLLHTRASAAAVGHHASEYLGYLSWPLLVVLVAAAIRFWPDLRARAAAVTWAVLELLSLGGKTLRIGGLHYPGWLLPWHWVQGLPGMAEVLPDRFALLADAAAAALLAFSLDLALAWVPQVRQWWRRGLVAAAVLVVVPLIPLPFAVSPVPGVPAGWQAAFARLHLTPDDRVLVLPPPAQFHTLAMRWQATSGEPGTLVAGYFLGPGPDRQSTFSPGLILPASDVLKHLVLQPPDVAVRQSASIALIRSDLAYWRPAAIIAVPGLGSPPLPVLTVMFGRPTIRVGRVLAWRYRAS